MKILLECFECKVSELYIQSLVLLYLPLEKFGKDDSDSELYVNIKKQENSFFGKAHLVYQNEKISCDFFGNYESFPAHLDKAKNFAGKLIIELFKKRFGFVPKWGMLTGVRPTRFAFDLSENGFSDRETVKLLCENYLVDPKKAELSVGISKIDKAVFDDSEEREYSLYVGIPFCPTRCKYCSFVSCATDKLKSLLPDYIEKLLKEIESVRRVSDNCGLKLKSIYVGGGTPSILDEHLLSSFLFKLRETNPENDIEFTFEAGRPDTVSEQKLSYMREYGVGRVCINTQTTDNKILASVGRGHTFEQYVSAFHLAKKYGFSVNTDLIAGLPRESLSGFCKSVDDCIKLCPENITVHSFSLKKSSDYTVCGTSISQNDNTFSQMLEYSETALSSAGYFPYYMYKHKNTAGNLENTGYSNSEKAIGLYNVYMMEGVHTVIACGAGASSKLVSRDRKSKNIYNPKYPYEYLSDWCDIHKKEKEIIDFYENTY